MRKILIKLFKTPIFLLSLIFSAKLTNTLHRVYNLFYSIWKGNQFVKVADNLSLHYPLYLRGGKYISVGSNFYSDIRVRIEAWDEHLGYKFSPKIIIGDNVSINSDCHIGAINEVIIEDGVLIASKVYITDHYHGEITTEAIELMPAKRKLFSKGRVKIEKNAWIGEGVVILPNVTIGENSIIGANSVVTKNIPKNSVAGGNPAKIIRTL
jgi:acetyltransferase-like isoleucine patch superfamily enzyme